MKSRMKTRALRPRTAIIFALLGLAALLPTRASAYSILLNAPPGWNGFTFYGSITTGYRETGGPGLMLTTNEFFTNIYPDGPLSFPNAMSTNSLAFTNYPTTGLPKDMSGAILDFVWTTGTPAAASTDKFDVRIQATNSAELAFVDFGSGAVQADAVVRAKFVVESAWPLSTAYGATLEIPAMSNLTTASPNIESMGAVATIGPYGGPATVSYTRVPGDLALVIPLDLAEFEFFRYELNYDLITPFGTDPGVDYGFSGGAATTIPEPSTVALLGLSAAASAFIYRRRK